MSNTNIIKDVKMSYFEDDIKKIQTKPNLYIRQYGDAGEAHLVYEIVQNAIDEILDPDSIGSKIHINFDKITQRFSVEDDGRGFPEKDFPLDIFCTKLQSGSKSLRDGARTTSGEFGVGMTVVNALSSEFTLTSNRMVEKTTHTITFKSGEKISDEVTDNKKKKHGSYVSFIINPFYLGIDAKIPIEDVFNWLDDLSYHFGDTEMIIKFDIWNGGDLESSRIIKSKPFGKLIEKYVTKPISPVVGIEKKGGLIEVVNNEDKERELTASLSFVYDPDAVLEYHRNEPTQFIDSFCNFSNTLNGGVHVNAAMEALCRYLQNATKKSMSDKEKEKIDILWQDIKDNILCIINVSTNAEVQFVGNAKNEIGNKALYPVIKELITTGLNEYFEKNPTELTSIIKVVKTNAKARIELSKIKNTTIKKRNKFENMLFDNYFPPNKDKSKYLEIYLIEGQHSAAGSLDSGRNHDFQAIFGFRGNTKNPYKCTYQEFMKNSEWNTLFTVIGWDPVKKNLDDLKYSKIIIATDADIDGDSIASGILAGFYEHAKPIIEAGKMYRVYSPLYSIIDGRNKTRFVSTKKEFVIIFAEKVSDSYKVKINGKELSKKEIKEFIKNSSKYETQLESISNYYSIDPYIIEVLTFHIHAGLKSVAFDSFDELVRDPRFIRNALADIHKKYPEIQIDNNGFVHGPAKKGYQSLNLKERFVTKTMKLNYLFDIYNSIMIEAQGKNNDDYVEYSIGDFLYQISNLKPVIKTRYKGLGEVNADDLSETVLDPAKRTLVQLTISDAEEARETVLRLHSSKTKYRELRKEMMSHYDIDYDDIDN